MDEDELEFLREQSISAQPKRVRLPPFRDNLKRTFKLFAKVCGVPCPTDFSQRGFEALCETFELRHRVTHPKSFMTFCIRDEEKARAGLAIDWLSEELDRLFNTSRTGLRKSTN
jgi:hypothetical protein